ncbi:MAG: aquaporin [Actinomycetota bacterium]|nr:aquaporin [Actinomycetota bacterium]
MEHAWQKALAEFVATFALIFIGAGAVIVAAPGIGNSGLVGVALAHGLVLAIMVSVTGHISGGHVNPAVTIGAWVTGQINTSLAGLYIVAQLAGATFGALLLRAAIPKSLWAASFLGSPTVAHTGGITNAKAVILEAILTFFLVFVVYGTAIDDRGPFSKIAGLPIGLVLTFDILAGGPFTGAAMNPARAFGPMLVSGHWTDWWVYWIGPIGGSIVAAAVYWFGFLGGREKLVSAPKTEQPIGGGPDQP